MLLYEHLFNLEPRLDSSIRRRIDSLSGITLGHLSIISLWLIIKGVEACIQSIHVWPWISNAIVHQPLIVVSYYSHI